MEIEEVRAPVSATDLKELREKFQGDLFALREQICILQVRATSMEAQLARIEPMVEARASRTEKLVMELQVDMHKLTKIVEGKEANTKDQYGTIESMLKIILERTEGGGVL